MKELRTITLQEYLTMIKSKSPIEDVVDRLLYSKWSSAMEGDNTIIVEPYHLTIWFLQNGLENEIDLTYDLIISMKSETDYVLLDSKLLQFFKKEEDNV